MKNKKILGGNNLTKKIADGSLEKKSSRIYLSQGAAQTFLLMARREGITLKTYVEVLLEKIAVQSHEDCAKWSTNNIDQNKHLARIRSNAAGFFGISVKKLIDGSRSPKRVDCRTALAGYLYTEARLTYSAIGRLLGNRDHTTIMNNVNNHKQWMTNNQPYREMYNAMKQSIESI